MERMIKLHDHVAAEPGEFSLPCVETAHSARTGNFLASRVDCQLAIALPGVVLNIDPSRPAVVKNKTQHATTRCSCSRDRHTKIGELHLVEIRSSAFSTVRKARRRRDIFQHKLARTGQQLKASVVLHGGPAWKMAAANAAKLRIRVVVRSHALLLRVLCRGSPLRHPEGHTHAGIGLAFGGCSNQRIHQVSEALRPNYRRQEKNDDNVPKKGGPHLKISFRIMRDLYAGHQSLSAWRACQRSERFGDQFRLK